MFRALAYWGFRRHLRAMSERDIHFHFHDLGEVVAPLIHLFNRGFDELKQEIRTMSANVTDRLATLTAEVSKLRTDGAKFRTDVLAALAVIRSGPLNAEQQAAFDTLDASVTAEDQATVDADAALSPAAPPAP